MLKDTSLYAILLCSLFIPMILFAADDPVEDIHNLTLQWTGLEHQKDMLRKNWRGDKPILEQPHRTTSPQRRAFFVPAHRALSAFGVVTGPGVFWVAEMERDPHAPL